MDGLAAKHEKTITYLEQDNVRITRESEERQLLWEQREVELERMIDSLERQQKDMANAALRVGYEWSFDIFDKMNWDVCLLGQEKKLWFVFITL